MKGRGKKKKNQCECGTDVSLLRVKMTLRYLSWLRMIHAGLQSRCSAGDSMQYAFYTLHILVGADSPCPDL